jgi:predicted ArsR family transcriptional regulator
LPRPRKIVRHIPPPRFLTQQHHKANEEKVYEACRSYVAEHGRPPSARALGEIVGMGHATANRHLLDLERSGRVVVTRHPGGRRIDSITFPE